MKHSTHAATLSECARFDKLLELGCIACILDGRKDKTLAEIHHFLSGNRRIGHHATVPLCTWHHTGTSTECNPKALLELLGPSFHKHTRAFRARYGSDSELLATVNEMIGEA